MEKNMAMENQNGPMEIREEALERTENSMEKESFFVMPKKKLETDMMESLLVGLISFCVIIICN